MKLLLGKNFSVLYTTPITQYPSLFERGTTNGCTYILRLTNLT